MEYKFEERKIVKTKNCVYLIKNQITNKLYIGSTIHLKKRITQHYNLLKINKHPNKKLQRTWNKYGENNFIFSIIQENIEINDLINKEQTYIDKFNTVKKGYNITPKAGTTLGNKWSKRAKKNYSKLKKLSHLGEPVIQYDLNGKKVNEFVSMKTAANSLGLKNSSNIGMCCRKERNTFGGYKWEYKNKDKQKKYGNQEFHLKIECPHCGGLNTKKSGFLRWRNNQKQIYKCNDCKKRFNETTNNLRVWGNNIKRNEKIVELFKDNKYNISDISKIMEISEITVKRVLKKHNINAKTSNLY